MYSLKEIQKNREDIKKGINALNNKELMNAVAFVRNSEAFDDDDVEYFKMAIIRDVDQNSDIAIQYLKDCLEYWDNILIDDGLMPLD